MGLFQTGVNVLGICSGSDKCSVADKAYQEAVAARSALLQQLTHDQKVAFTKKFSGAWTTITSSYQDLRYSINFEGFNPKCCELWEIAQRIQVLVNSMYTWYGAGGMDDLIVKPQDVKPPEVPKSPLDDIYTILKWGLIAAIAVYLLPTALGSAKKAVA